MIGKFLNGEVTVLLRSEEDKISLYSLIRSNKPDFDEEDIGPTCLLNFVRIKDGKVHTSIFVSADGGQVIQFSTFSDKCIIKGGIDLTKVQTKPTVAPFDALSAIESAISWDNRIEYKWTDEDFIWLHKNREALTRLLASLEDE